MDIKDYWKNGCFGEYHDIYAKNLAEQFYNAGQQSKQEEIESLQKEVDELKFKIQSSLNTACRLQYSIGERIYTELKEILK